MIKSIERKIVGLYGLAESAEDVHELVKKGVELTPRIRCPICSEEVDVWCIVAHMAREHGKMSGGTRVCGVCSRRFKSEVEYLKHVRSHFVYVVMERGISRWVCSVCGRRFLGRRSVFIHLMKAHERCA